MIKVLPTILIIDNTLGVELKVRVGVYSYSGWDLGYSSLQLIWIVSWHSVDCVSSHSASLLIKAACSILSSIGVVTFKHHLVRLGIYQSHGLIAPIATFVTIGRSP